MDSEFLHNLDQYIVITVICIVYLMFLLKQLNKYPQAFSLEAGLPTPSTFAMFIEPLAVAFMCSLRNVYPPFTLFFL